MIPDNITVIETPTIPLPVVGSVWRRRRFNAAMERQFQASYYARVRPTLRVVGLLLAALLSVAAVRDFLDTRALWMVLGYNGSQVGFCLLVFGLTFVPGFTRVWQPVIVVLGCLTVALSADALSSFLAAVPSSATDRASVLLNSRMFFVLQMAILMIVLAAFRLQFVWASLLLCGLVGVGLWNLWAHLGAVASLWPVGLQPFETLRFFGQELVLVGIALALGAYVQEQLSRNAFWANHLLEAERNDERGRREQTEKMLHVLGQAIGGIVHDLGNPLTSVQTGAETLRHFVQDGQADPVIIAEFADIICGGARMLSFLRLSLIEQARVLEGQPTPVEVKPVTIRAVVEIGAQFQKPRFVSGRHIELEGADVQVCADEMKLATVFMNLIGNALKYSDGEVCVCWRACPASKMLLIAVLDHGTAGQGITREQARKLFTPFGRLEAHARIEGTGLGLLSVQQVVEAHGGEAFLEGFEDGAPPSSPFSTARSACPALLRPPFRTAFVVTCPLAR